MYQISHRLKLTSMMCQFLALADIVNKKNPYFGKHFLAKQELIMRIHIIKLKSTQSQLINTQYR